MKDTNFKKVLDSVSSKPICLFPHENDEDRYSITVCAELDEKGVETGKLMLINNFVFDSETIELEKEEIEKFRNSRDEFFEEKKHEFVGSLYGWENGWNHDDECARWDITK